MVDQDGRAFGTQQCRTLVFALALAMILVLVAACGPTTSPETDRAALAALYHGTDGANWLRNSNWLSDAPMGEWDGVTTNDDGRVIKLDLGANELSGQIPPELGNLDKLAVLDLAAERTVTTLSGKVGIRIGGDSPSFSSQLEEAGRQLARSAETSIRRNYLSGCIASSLEDRLDLEQSDLGGLPFCNDSDEARFPGHGPDEIIVPITEAEEATLPCGEYGFGMGLEASDLPMVQCIIDKSRGEEGRADLLSGMMVDAIHSSNQDAFRLLLDAGVDADGQGPLGSSFLLSALNNLTFVGRTGQGAEAENAAAVANILVDEGARIQEPPGEEYVNVWFAAAQLSPDAMRTMIRAGMDVNIRPPLDESFDLDTALVGAVARACGGDDAPSLEIVHALVGAGADVNTMSIGQIFDDNGREVIGVFESDTLLSIAEGGGTDCLDVVNILSEAGACRYFEGRRIEWGSNLDFGGILRFLSAQSAFPPRENVECAASAS